MAEPGPVGIGACLTHIGLHAGKIGKMEVDARELVPAQIVQDRNGEEFLVLLDVAQTLLALKVGQLDNLADAIERSLDAVRRLLGDEHDAVVAAVGGELDAEAIDDASAWRRDQMLADAIGFGLDLVL